MISLTRAQVVALKPCSLSKIPAFKRGQSMTATEALEAGVSIDDLLWVAHRMGRRDLCVKFALACAQRVAYLNPDPRVQKALDAAQAWLDNPNKETANATYAAANAAANAATYAAYAATYAAYAAANAAYAATYALPFAATYAAAKNQEKAEQRRIFLEIFGEERAA